MWYAPIIPVYHDAVLKISHPDDIRERICGIVILQETSERIAEFSQGRYFALSEIKKEKN
jgi:hypothetical protein